VRSFSVEVSARAVRDLDAIFDHLVASYQGFGDSEDEALKRAAGRLRRIRGAALALGKAPHPGTLRPELRPGLRSVTKDRAIFYFDVDDETCVVRVLAVFFGGQDHQRAMLKRVMATKHS
jgi:toxin ParE1/3/4